MCDGNSRNNGSFSSIKRYSIHSKIKGIRTLELRPGPGRERREPGASLLLKKSNYHVAQPKASSVRRAKRAFSSTNSGTQSPDYTDFRQIQEKSLPNETPFGGEESIKPPHADHRPGAHRRPEAAHELPNNASSHAVSEVHVPCEQRPLPLPTTANRSESPR